MFCDLFIKEQDKVQWVVHCLEDEEYFWWLRLFEKKYVETYPPWREFQELLYSQFFKDNTK